MDHGHDWNKYSSIFDISDIDDDTGLLHDRG